MSKKIENLGEVTFKVNLLDSFHDFVLRWSKKSECYEGKQFFEQLASITGIPSIYTRELTVLGGAPPRPYNSFRVQNGEAKEKQNLKFKYRNFNCNDLAREIIRHKNEFANDCFILIFDMNCSYDKHFYITYYLDNPLFDIGPGCLMPFCRSRHTKDALDKMRRIINDDELHANMKGILKNPRTWIFGHDSWMPVFEKFGVSSLLKCSCYKQRPGHHSRYDRSSG